MAATDKLRDAQLRAADAAVGQQSALDQLRTSVQNGTTSVEDAKNKLYDMAAQGLISADTAAAVAAQFDAIARAQGRIDRNVEINVVTRQSTVLAGSRNVPLRAHGGPTWAGQVFQVAEQGPELLEEGGRTYLIPGGKGRVIPFAGSGGGGQPLEVHSHLYIDGQQVAEVVRTVVARDHGGDVQAALGYSR